MMQKRWTTLYRSLADLLMPRLCCGCGQRLALDEQLVCAGCQMALPLETNHDWAYNQRMNRWAAHKRLVRMGALTRYEHGNIAANIIHELKYHRRPELGLWMGRVAVAMLGDTGLYEGVDALVPLPLTRARKRFRGFNQSEQIAKGMGEALGIPVLTNVLRRTVERESQTHFSLHDRLENAQRVFDVDEVDKLDNQHIMLVDDVMTTGTTMLGAVEVLEERTDVRLSCFTWAWVTLSKHSMASSTTDVHT